MKNYENYKVEVEKLSKELEGCKNRCVVLEDEIADIKGKWYPKLVNLIEIINNKFSEFFQTMRCVGVVELDKGTKEEEFENYGLSIKVKFRDEQKLQQLDSCVQSGGERALTTAVFMLSLQGITNVPFRCVDEINQGMDEFNERRVYELLTNSVSQLDTAQYFLLTPKVRPTFYLEL
ncbi:hypothetical protein AAG570_004489 [Ranatra chinensis]|uniref:Structural maintenance of chromosomes protein 5 n=1 Tax=Ranatra chinensis TaxID=642074 RepID=A0ABD0Y1U2_9HEMI